MAFRRSKHMVSLVSNNNQDIQNANVKKRKRFYNKLCTNKTEKHVTRTSVERLSPLPPGATAIWDKMRDVRNEIFSDDDREGSFSTATISKHQNESLAIAAMISPSILPVADAPSTDLSPRILPLPSEIYRTEKEIDPRGVIREDAYMPVDETIPSPVIDPSVLPVPIAPPTELSPRILPLPSENYQTDKDIDPRDVIIEDAYMPVDEMTPAPVIDYPQSVSSYIHHNDDSPAPLTPIFNNLLSIPSPVQNINNSNSPVQNIDKSNFSTMLKTPIPSPINKHSKCDDPFCCQHEIDEFTCPSVNSIGTDSNQPSPAPTALIRNRGKKRLRNHKDWSDVKRKKLKNLGKTYCSKRGRTVEAKAIRSPCRCRFKCSTKISNDERNEIFRKFWDLGDREKQWLYVANYTNKQNKSRTFRRELKHNREFTYKYFLPKTVTENVTHDKIDVCKTMFLNTLGISERMTRTAWQKYDGSTSVEHDMRGRHGHHKKVVDGEMLLSVCAHVNSFVPVETHYCRKSSKRLYLDGSLSVARMFKMYNEWPDLVKYTKTATTLRQYRDIVNTQFNLTFHIPKKDTCDQCHIFKHTESPSDELKTDFEKHQTSKSIARNLKNIDKTNASKSNGTIVCSTFDFQKVLTCPHGQISVLYYKRKLSCYNFTVYDMTTKEGYCYVWDESVAKRGSNEVASCLYNFIKDFSEKGVVDFRFWSDNCAGQNKNRFVFAMYTHAAKEFGVSITHRFLEKGHTQNEGDSVHSVIERVGEHKLIYTPEEWKLLIRWAKTEKPYEVRDVTKELVYDFKELLKYKNWTKNTLNEKITWTKIKEVMIEETQPNKILYKYDLDDDHKTLIVRKDTRNRNATELKNAYNEPVSISNDKFKDLIDLCESGIIPTKYHEYFKALPHGRITSNETDDDSE